MAGPIRSEKIGVEEVKPSEKGVRIKFPNADLLRAYILDPERPAPTPTLSEIRQGVREINLGEVPLDGELFKSARTTLIIESDRESAGKKPTVIIRTDLQLGDYPSSLSKFQSAVKNKQPHSQPDEDYLIDKLAKKTNGLAFPPLPFSTYTSHIYQTELLEEENETKHLTLLQIWDKDLGKGSISVSLLSIGRYLHDFYERDRKLSVNTQKNPEYYESGKDSEISRWQFENPVGIDTEKPEEFNKALAFYEEALTKTIDALYQNEGISSPNIVFEIEPPFVLNGEDKMTFNDIGGQKEAVGFLQSYADSLKNGQIEREARPLLLSGPPGNGKTSMVKALGTELGAQIVTKTTLDIAKGEGDIFKTILAGFYEAKAAAAKGAGKAILCLENLEEVLSENHRVHDVFINMMDELFANDDQVILTATSNFPDGLHGGILDRFNRINVLPPNKRGVREIIDIHIQKLRDKFDRPDLFAEIDLDKVAQRIYEMKFTGRNIKKFLSSLYSLRKSKLQEAGDLGMTETEFALSKLQPQKQIGFALPR